MGDKTGILWADATWNPFLGCTAVSAGCDNCYAARLTSGRLAHQPAYAGLAQGGRFTGEVRLLPDRLGIPLAWTKPRRVFVNSMSDMFHEGVPDDYIAQMFAVIAVARNHQFLVLTKRHARMRHLMNDRGFQALYAHRLGLLTAELLQDKRKRRLLDPLPQPSVWPLPNLWLGVSVEDQRTARMRIDALRETPAAVRFLSCEPLLGWLDLDAWLPDLNWVIVGGESGPNARPMAGAWVKLIRRQCEHYGVAFLMKQWGEFVAEPGLAGPGSARDPDGWVDLNTGVYLPGRPSDGAGQWEPVWRNGTRHTGRSINGLLFEQYPDPPEAWLLDPNSPGQRGYF